MIRTLVYAAVCLYSATVGALAGAGSTDAVSVRHGQAQTAEQDHLAACDRAIMRGERTTC